MQINVNDSIDFMAKSFILSQYCMNCENNLLHMTVLFYHLQSLKAIIILREMMKFL